MKWRKFGTQTGFVLSVCSVEDVGVTVTRNTDGVEKQDQVVLTPLWVIVVRCTK